MGLSQATRNDANKGGWVNTLTGLGQEGRDKRLASVVNYQPLQEVEVEELFGQDDIAGRVVTLPAELGTCNWIETKFSEDGGGKDLKEKIDDELKRLNVKEKMRDAWQWSRLYGGAGIFISVDDGKDLSLPLDLKSLKKIKNFTVLSRYELHHGAIDFDLESDNFMNPLWYWLGPRVGGTSSEQLSKAIHYTRIIRFDGVKLPRRLHIQNNYWSDSVLTRLFNVLRNFNLAHDSTTSIVQDFRLGILKIKNLADIISAGESDALNKRIETMNLSKSVLGTILLDSEDESFENLTSTLSGMDGLLEKVNQRLTSATGLPHTIVHGEGASGFLSGSGDAEDRQLVKFIEALQDKTLTRPIDRTFELIFAQTAGPANGNVPEGFSWEFKPLVEKTDDQKTEVRSKQATTDSLYIADGVLSPDEVRESRFGGKEFSLETKIFEDDREDAVKDHGHGDPLSGYTGGAVLGDGVPSNPLDPNHLHLRPNGMMTGPANFLPSGIHFHSAGDRETSPSMTIEQIAEIELSISKNEGLK